MRSFMTGGLVSGLVFLLVAQCPAAVIWDGSGSPESVGYTDVRASGKFSFDTPSPGLMTQNTSEWGVWRLIAASELDSTAGWIVEARAEATNVPNDTNALMALIVQDETDNGATILFEDTQVRLADEYWNTVDEIVVSHTGGFHTVSLERLAGGGDVVVTIDGVNRGTVAAYPPGGATASITFGGANGGGEGVWDYVKLNAGTTGPIPGDANEDGKVTDADAAILATNWQRSGDATWNHGDFNNDTNVTDADAAILATHWQEGVTEGAAAVPEPTVFVLLAGGLLLLPLWRKR